MEKSTVEKYMKEGSPVWIFGKWTAMPAKARVVRISEDRDADGCAEIEYMLDGECIIHHSKSVLFEDLFETKEDIIAAMFEAVMQNITEIKAAIQTKDDCIQLCSAMM